MGGTSRPVLAAVVLMLSACASVPTVASYPALTSPELSCVDANDGVTWVHTAPAAHRPTLDAWCASIGPPWLHAGGTTSTPATTLIVVSWNMNVGRGDLSALLDYVDTEFKDVRRAEGAGVVFLLQEVHRVGEAVPESPRFPRAVPREIRSPASALDVQALARAHNLSAVYVPSMRNGPAASAPEDRQDRGNAILTTEAITAPTAVELPFGRQRRVAVAATIRGIRFISVHLDTSRDRVTQAEALVAADMPAASSSVVAGDLNSVGGLRDGTYTTLARRFPSQPCGNNRTHAWPWRLELFFGGWVGRLDHFFTSLPPGRWSTSCVTVPHVFGSDHRPLVLILRPAPV